ncbi:AI-2E family transporter [Natronorarus salvus]|uniref:AI-2E family transporter n=1 Tax=Natronorarus salvus TaxID=3117733 RepID=UPI002F265A66
MSYRPAAAPTSERRVLAILALASCALALFVALPYLQYILLGGVLAYVLAPAQRTLAPVFGRTGAALSLLSTAVVLLILPVLYVLSIAVRQASGLATTAQREGWSAAGIERELQAIGGGFDVDQAIATYETHQTEIDGGVQGVLSGAAGFVGGVPSILIGLTVTAFVLFSLLRDGDRLAAWLLQVAPMRETYRDELFTELDRLMWASVVGNVVVAAIQAVLLGAGLYLLDVPGVVLLTVATFVLALLPLVGAFAVWVPVSIYLLVLGRPGAAAILAVYGAIVSASDLYLRPAIIGKSGTLSSGVIVVGIFGGVAVFGAVGLFVGPVIIGSVKVVLELFSRTTPHA